MGMISLEEKTVLIVTQLASLGDPITILLDPFLEIEKQPFLP
jgi:hypothetical protein